MLDPCAVVVIASGIGGVTRHLEADLAEQRFCQDAQRLDGFASRAESRFLVPREIGLVSGDGCHVTLTR